MKGGLGFAVLSRFYAKFRVQSFGRDSLGVRAHPSLLANNTSNHRFYVRPAPKPYTLNAVLNPKPLNPKPQNLKPLNPKTPKP